MGGGGGDVNCMLALELAINIKRNADDFEDIDYW